MENTKEIPKNYTFYAMLSRMKYIERWALMRNSVHENISEHSLETAMIVLGMAFIGNARHGKHYDAEHLAACAMYHDCTEIMTGDMPTPVKYQNEDIKSTYKEVERIAAYTMINKLPADLRSFYEELILQKSLSSEDKKLIKAADKMSALIKCIEEEKNGNTEFSKAKDSTLCAIHKLNCIEAEDFIVEFLPAYRLTLDEL
ncbi:MAG: 5'-deoxynucleotidase [Lachnospiraceae bacterium]|nr:5'-deoxynucleotidase [Lachnospiraceae bacterium]MEE3460777.1 5'-deoxynucleotidase [Lachnospiraceae bacterium]